MPKPANTENAAGDARARARGLELVAALCPMGLDEGTDGRRGIEGVRIRVGAQLVEAGELGLALREEIEVVGHGRLVIRMMRSARDSRRRRATASSTPLTNFTACSPLNCRASSMAASITTARGASVAISS